MIKIMYSILKIEYILKSSIIVPTQHNDDLLLGCKTTIDINNFKIKVITS